jgi:hypothetical protein
MGNHEVEVRLRLEKVQGCQRVFPFLDTLCGTHGSLANCYYDQKEVQSDRTNMISIEQNCEPQRCSLTRIWAYFR